VVEWGPGIYGAEAVAQYYFHKPAAALTVGEAVRLAAVLPDPLDWSPLRPTRRVLARGAAIHSNMAAVSAALSPPCRRTGIEDKASGPSRGPADPGPKMATSD
jgi:monofunctional biosynthetic peptidoglycan transglycosylase